MNVAITREVSRAIGQCELTFLERQPIDVARARQQHAAYEAALTAGGLSVLALPEQPSLPDSVFVEDIAIVLDECAVITRPGADSRRGEIATIAAALATFRQLHFIESPGHLDGGDVLRLGKQIFVGASQRTDSQAIEQLARIVEPLGYSIHGIAVEGCLHLKSAVTEAAPEVVLINPEWVDASRFPGVKTIEVDPSESYAANTLKLGGRTLVSASFPRTRERLERAGINTISLECDELEKAEGALTCCSLIFESTRAQGRS